MGRYFSRRFAAPGMRTLAGALQRFAEARQGATAVEFGLIVGPFIATLFVIFEVSYLFLVGEALDNGTTAAARRILTGQAQSSSGSTKISNQATFRQYALCPNLPTLIDCSKVQTNVAKINSFKSTDANLGAKSVITSSGTLDTSSWAYTPCQTTTGVPDIMKVEAVYPVSAMSAFFGYTDTVTMSGVETRVLYTSSVFRCEPF